MRPCRRAWPFFPVTSAVKATFLLARFPSRPRSPICHPWTNNPEAEARTEPCASSRDVPWKDACPFHFPLRLEIPNTLSATKSFTCSVVRERAFPLQLRQSLTGEGEVKASKIDLRTGRN